jgi:hypothetical protein
VNKVRRIALSIAILLSHVSIPVASAEITDFVYFPYNETTFDSITKYSVLEYEDSLSMGMWNRVRKGPAPFSGELTLSFSHNVNIRTYTFETELISPTGKTIPLAGRQSTSETEYSVYCWGTYCKTTYLFYSVTLPENSEVGKYNLRFTAKWLGSNCVGTVCESGVTKSQSTTAVGALEITGATPTPTPTPTPIPTPTPTPTSDVDLNIPLTDVVSFNLNNGQIGCNTYEFTKVAIDQYEIIGTRWRIKSLDGKSGARVLDEYNWGLPLGKNGELVSIQTKNGLKFSSKEGTGPIIYAYAIRNQEKGASYECSVAIRTKNGNGPYSTVNFRGTMNSKDFNLQTITCIKGKLTKKVTAASPKCPTGYKKK